MIGQNMEIMFTCGTSVRTPESGTAEACQVSCVRQTQTASDKPPTCAVALNPKS